MGKRSSFERYERDFYRTPIEAVLPLLPYIGGSFVEPCAGDGALIDILESNGLKCVWASDIEPQRDGIKKQDALCLPECQYKIITNTPWDRKLLHPMIERFVEVAPAAWLLLDSDWAFTRQSSKYMAMCSHIIAVGRVKWIPGSAMTGKDNCAWYRFSKDGNSFTRFTGR